MMNCLVYGYGYGLTMVALPNKLAYLAIHYCMLLLREFRASSLPLMLL